MSIINGTGRTIATIHLSNGQIISFFNDVCDFDTQITYSNPAGLQKYNLTADTGSMTNKYRCAYYVISLPQSPIFTKPRPVIFIPNNVTLSNNQNIPVQPLYEFIAPSVARLGYENYQLTWWSNMDETPKTDINGYCYDSTKIKRFSQHLLDTIEVNNTSTQILCSASIRWELLSQKGGGVQDTMPILTPVITNPLILSLNTGYGYITDFATNTGGGGNGSLPMHSHTSVTDGGFAAAVFMPSAVMRPFNWR